MWENDKGWNQKKTQNYNNWSSKGDTKEIQQTRNNDTYIVKITQKLLLHLMRKLCPKTKWIT